MKQSFDHPKRPGFGVSEAEVSALLAEAHRRRSESLQRSLVATGRALRNAAKSVLGRIEARRARREALNSLLAMGDRELRDIGLTRETILARFEGARAPARAANQDASKSAA